MEQPEGPRLFSRPTSWLAPRWTRKSLAAKHQPFARHDTSPVIWATPRSLRRGGEEGLAIGEFPGSVGHPAGGRRRSMYAFTHPCPNCGAPVPFGSAIAVFAVCGFCRSSVVRRDAAVEGMGQQAQLPPDVSPLQVGTRGRWQGKAFTLVGRVRVGYREGTWNEWCADFGDGTWGWVAEAQGFYMASIEVAPPDDLPGVKEWRGKQDEAGSREDWTLLDARLVRGRESLGVGARVRIGGEDYLVRDTKQTEVLGSEGSLPFVAVPGRAAISGDLGAPGRRFANVEYAEDGIRVFLGTACTFHELGFENLRPLPGWTAGAADAGAAGVGALNCPSCGAAMALRAAGQTMTASCAGCGGLLDTSHPDVRCVGVAAERQKNVVAKIPVGRRGTLLGVEWECIGFLRRRDGEGYTWDEYLLFNPFEGFRWLVTYQGHWSFVEMLLEAPRVVDGRASAGGVEHRLFARGTATVTYVLGEFYWQVRHGEQAGTEDYVAPPWVVSRETFGALTEETWSRGEYVAGSEVHGAFGLEGEPREPWGVYLNQPNPHREKGRTLRWLFPALAGGALVMALMAAAGKDNELAWRGNFQPVDAGTNGAVVGPPFELTGSRRQAVEVELDAPVSNGWLEVEGDLVDVTTGRVEREFVVGVDFYSGVDGGEAWQEGETRRSVVLGAVPPGRYRLVMETSMEPSLPELPVQVSVRRDVMIWSNVWLALAGLLAYPVYRWAREASFEHARWSVSGFLPSGQARPGDDADDGEDDSLSSVA